MVQEKMETRKICQNIYQTQNDHQFIERLENKPPTPLKREKQKQLIIKSIDINNPLAQALLPTLTQMNTFSGNGYYLYSAESRKGGQCAESKPAGTDNTSNLTITTEDIEEADESEDDDPYGGLPVQIININMSFWYWW